MLSDINIEWNSLKAIKPIERIRCDIKTIFNNLKNDRITIPDKFPFKISDDLTRINEGLAEIKRIWKIFYVNNFKKLNKKIENFKKFDDNKKEKENIDVEKYITGMYDNGNRILCYANDILIKYIAIMVKIT